MNQRKNFAVRELVKASAALQAAYIHAQASGDRELVAQVRGAAVEVTTAISTATRPEDLVQERAS